MLNSFLDKLTSLLSKSYVISAGFPVLIFTFVNASLLYAHHAGFRAFINTEAPSSSFSALTSKVLMFVLILVILAYILSTLQPKLRELLEGHRWYGWMGDPFRAIQKEKYDRLTKDYAIIVGGRVIGYGANYHEAEQKRTAYLADQAAR